MAAGVVSAASVVSIPEHRWAPTISADVANTSVITDTLYSLGKGVEVLSSTVGIHVDATISLPFEATLAVLAAARNPELAPTVLSYLVQRFVNPAVGEPIRAYPWDFRQTVAVLAGLLPYPLGPSAAERGFVLAASHAVADAFNAVLGRLVDPLPGFDAVRDVMDNTVIGGVVVAGQQLVRAPLYMAWNTVDYLGNLPANLVATLESAIRTPDQIPGLLSNLVYGLLSPDARVGLLGQLLDNAIDPFTRLPGGWAQQTHDAIAGSVDRVLSVLPAPVTPQPAGSEALAVAEKPVDPVKKPSGTTPLRVRAPASPVSDDAATDRAADEAEHEAEPAKAEPAKAEPAKAERTKREPKKAEPKKTEPGDSSSDEASG
jgi:hypothetical protein